MEWDCGDGEKESGKDCLVKIRNPIYFVEERKSFQADRYWDRIGLLWGWCVVAGNRRSVRRLRRNEIGRDSC